MMEISNRNFVYHYCSPETFLAIIEQKAIRLSDINKMDDCMEKRWVASFLLGNIDGYLKDNGIPMNLDQEYKYNEKSKTHRAYFVNLMNDFVYQAEPVLVGCFSQKGDSLGQWSAYGAGGKGFSIGFDQTLLEELEAEATMFQPYISYKKLVYDEAEQQANLQAIVKAAIDRMIGDYENTALGGSYYSFESYFYDEFDSFCDFLMNAVRLEACFIKNPAFQEEEESRITAVPSITETPSITEARKKAGFEFSKEISTIREGKMTVCSDMSFAELMDKGIIGKVIIGPKSEITAADLRFLFASNGYDNNKIAIEKSAASIRQ